MAHVVRLTHESIEIEGINKPLIVENENHVGYEGINRVSDVDDHKDNRQGTILSSFVILCNTAIGAGLLGLPEAISNTGYYLGGIFLLFFGLTALFGLHISVTVANTFPTTSYHVIRHSISKNMIHCSWVLPILVDVCVGAMCYGACCAYLIVIGDLMDDVLSKSINDAHIKIDSRIISMLIFFAIFVVPTMHLKTMYALRFTSSIALICYIYTAISVTIYATVDISEACASYEDIEDCHGGYIATPKSKTEILLFFQAAPVMIFAYTCHQNTFVMSNELQNNNSRRLNITILLTVIFCFIMYCVVGFGGYFTYGSNSPNNILTAYPDSIVVVVNKIALAVAMSFSYPLYGHPTRDSLASIFFGVAEAKILPKNQYYGISYFILFSTLIIAMITNDLGLVIGLIGSTGSTIVSFILPALFYLYLNDDKLRQTRCYTIKRIGCFIMFIVGIVLIPFLFVLQFVNLTDSN
eukprot:35867_1